MKITAIVVAAGRGARMGTDIPKVFLPLDGVPIVTRTLRALARIPELSEVVLVIGPNTDEHAQAALRAAAPWPWPITVAVGGAERQDSVAAGLAFVSDDTDLVVVHDGARPFLRPDQAAAAIAEAAQSGAAILAVPSRDTVKIVDQRQRITATPPRQSAWLAQTPQVFRASLLREAHMQPRLSDAVATDDAALVERLGVPVQVVPGDPSNVKITTPADLQWAEWYLTVGSALR